MKKVEIFKEVLEFVVSIGTGAIVGNVVKATTPIDIGRYKKVTILVSSFVLSRMTADMATDYTRKRIDELTDRTDYLAEKLQEAKENEAKIEPTVKSSEQTTS